MQFDTASVESHDPSWLPESHSPARDQAAFVASIRS
jgi:hypothetical protein